MNNKHNYKKTDYGITTKKYINYLVDVIQENGLHPPFEDCNFKNYAILAKYFKGNTNVLTKTYNQQVIKRLLKLDIVKPAETFYYVDRVKAYRYDLNVSNFKAILDYYGIAYPNILHSSRVLDIYHIIDSVLDTHISIYIPLICTKILKKAYNNVKFGKTKIKNEYFTDEQIYQILYTKYPMLEHFYKLHQKLNDARDDKDKIRCDKYIPSITRANKYISKIGIRCTNYFSDLPSINKRRKINGDCTEEYHDYAGSREEYLDNYYGKDNWEEYDVNGSIPMMCHFIYKGILKDLDTDTYQECYGNVGGTWNSDFRKFVKAYSMRAIFGGSAREIKSKLKYLGKYYDFLDEHLDELKEAEQNYCNNPKDDTSIFMHESNIYLMVKEKLEIELKLDIFQCYDGFYFRKGEMPNMNKIITECMKNYKENWLN